MLCNPIAHHDAKMLIFIILAICGSEQLLPWKYVTFCRGRADMVLASRNVRISLKLPAQFGLTHGWDTRNTSEGT